MDLSKIEKYLAKDDFNELETTDELNERFYGFGQNGTVEVHGKDVVISKDGKSIQMTKQELIDILLKLGVAKRKTR